MRGRGHEIEDFGAYNENAVDLSDHVYPAALAVGEGRAERGIFVDGVGYGSALSPTGSMASTQRFVRTRSVRGLARSHSDTNVLCIGGKIIGSAIALEVAETWMTPHSSVTTRNTKGAWTRFRRSRGSNLKPLPVQ